MLRGIVQEELTKTLKLPLRPVNYKLIIIMRL